MSYLEAIRAALDSLRANLLRTTLTTLGIVIGVAAVIAMVAVGAGARSQVSATIQSLGANILMISNGTTLSSGARGGAGSVLALTAADAEALERDAPSIALAAPSVRGTAQVVFGNSNWFTTLQGVTDNYLESRDWTIARGRNLTPGDVRGAAKVAIVGQTIVEKLFEGDEAIGQWVRIQKVPFEIVGVLAPKGQTPFGSDQDDVVVLPLTTAKNRVLGGRMVRGDSVGSITVEARSAELLDDAEREIKEVLRIRHRIGQNQPDDFTVRNISQFMEARAASQRTMSVLLASVAGVSLLVGGIGIMNIMLVSVTERTAEIGLRMAVGAQSRDVMVQFVIEAVALAFLGGLLGITLGVSGSVLLAELAGWPVVVQPSAILAAVGFSAAVGVFFGYYPARKASRLDPIEALRHG